MDRKKLTKFFTSLVFVCKSMSLKHFRIEQYCEHPLTPSFHLFLHTTPLCNHKS